METMMEERPPDAATAHTSEVVFPDAPTTIPDVSVTDSSSCKGDTNAFGFSNEEISQFEAEMYEFIRQQETPLEDQPQIRPPSPVEIKEEQVPPVPVPPVDAAAQSYRRAKPKPSDPKPVLTRPPIAQQDLTAPENAYRRKPSTKVAVGSAHTVNGIATPGPTVAAALPMQVHVQPAEATAKAVEKSKTRPVNPDTETQQHANPIYERPIADHATNSYRCIGIGASPIENDRQLVAMSHHQQAVTQRRVSVTPKRAVDNGLFSTITGYLGIAPAAAEEEAEEVSTGAKAAAEVRELKVRLSMDDPLLAVESRRAHQLFVQGASLTDLKAAGVRASHLLDIGVNYSAFETAGMGVRDLLFLEATWEDIVAMG